MSKAQRKDDIEVGAVYRHGYDTSSVRLVLAEWPDAENGIYALPVYRVLTETGDVFFCEMSLGYWTKVSAT